MLAPLNEFIWSHPNKHLTSCVTPMWLHYMAAKDTPKSFQCLISISLGRYPLAMRNFFFFVMFWDKNWNWFKPQRTKETWNERQTGRQKWWREEWINVSCCLGWWICDGTSGGLMPACWRLIMGHKVGKARMKAGQGVGRWGGTVGES